MTHETHTSLGDPTARDAQRLPFVEAFGPTIQGEGPAAGRLATFIRFGGCNLSCSWCDSAYTWDADRFNLRDEIALLTAAEVLDQTPAAPLFIITGGEPLLNQRNPAFIAVIEALAGQGEVHVETNGTITPNADVRQHVARFSVSPKLAHAGEHKRRQNPALAPGWQTLHGMTVADLKVVVIDEDDVRAAKELADCAGWPADHVWVMPEGTTTEVLARRWPSVCEWATRHGVNATHRLHVLAWGDERGH